VKVELGIVDATLRSIGSGHLAISKVVDDDVDDDDGCCWIENRVYASAKESGPGNAVPLQLGRSGL
jgi:hypothetical protein